ncbi:ASPC1 protein, partial [Atractosteus spatula]|nr:ASPC1 protein [Atractosteus spatula]
MAANSTAVIVLAPNGRRQTVKVLHSTPLLQVLEDVCKKQGFNPDEYDLKFQRTVLDLSLQWRFASLPNNAKLEMVPSTRQRAGVESTVRIALQLEDGSRLQDSFCCGQSLWELINHFPHTRVPEPQLSGSTPVCVYMRDEVAGEEALKKTTLKSLGLTGGSAIVRYVLKKSKSPEQGEPLEMGSVAAVKKEERPETADQPPPPDPTPKPVVSAALDKTEPEPSAKKPVAIPSPLRGDATEASGDVASLDDPKPKGAENAPVKDLVTETQESELKPSSETPGPSTELPSRMKPASAHVPNPSTFVPFSGGGQRLGGPGAGGPTGGSGQLNSSSLTSLSSPGGPPKAKKPKPSSESKGPVCAKHGEWDIEQGEEFLEPVDRDPLVFHMDAGERGHSNSVDLPDEFFEVTVDDIRKRFAQLKSERKLFEEVPLMTRALRESQMKEKMEKYPKVVVRVQFPDRHVLQGFFRPLETIGALREFVKKHLEDPQLRFYLFITPPKTNLDDPATTLFQANLFPAALVYFGSDVKADYYLQKQLLDSKVPPQQADDAVAGCMPRSPTPSSTSADSEEFFPPPLDSNAPANQKSTAADQPQPQTNSQAPKPVKTDPSKVPKWLKLPGKK